MLKIGLVHELTIYFLTELNKAHNFGSDVEDTKGRAPYSRQNPGLSELIFEVVSLQDFVYRKIISTPKLIRTNGRNYPSDSSQ